VRQQQLLLLVMNHLLLLRGTLMLWTPEACPSS
jgi:hypothetical protein